MSDRERWIVYPLLCFALMLGFRGASQSTLKCRDVECQSLRVQTINGTAYVPGTTTVIVTPNGVTTNTGSPGSPASSPTVGSTAPAQAAPAHPPDPSAAKPNGVEPNGAEPVVERPQIDAAKEGTPVEASEGATAD